LLAYAQYWLANATPSDLLPTEKFCWCRSTLETLAQLHGTGLAFKKSVGGNKEILKLFPDLEEQIQIKVYYA